MVTLLAIIEALLWVVSVLGALIVLYLFYLIYLYIKIVTKEENEKLAVVLKGLNEVIPLVETYLKSSDPISSKDLEVLDSLCDEGELLLNAIDSRYLTSPDAQANYQKSWNALRSIKAISYYLNNGKILV